MNDLAAQLGIAMPGPLLVEQCGAALALVLVAGAIAWLAGRWLGPPLVAFWEKQGGTPGAPLTRRVCAIVRSLILWPVLAIALRAYDWPRPAAFLIGFVAAWAAALVVRHVIRGLSLPRWIAWALALFLFVAILADAVGGLSHISGPLDAVAFSIGSRRLSLLALIQIAVSLLALYAGVKLAHRLVGRTIGRASGLDPTQRLLGQKLAAIAIVTIAFFIGIDLAGIDLTALAFFSGALGLAVGFGLQKTFGNLIAGIILLMDRSIKPGDVISVGETFGQVSKIGVRAVSIVTRDGKEYLIPNELLMTQEVVNWSYSTKDVRVSIPVNIGFDCDTDLAERLMIEAADASPRVLAVPKPNVWLTKFGDNALNYEIRVWIVDPEAGIGPVRSEILSKVLELFRANGIALPYPQREIRMRDWPEAPVPPARRPTG